jgi:NifU-like protein involved in Fe-S cluster formation
MDYSDEVRQRFASPNSVGELQPAPDVISAVAGSVEQGAKYWLYARIHGERIEDLKYRVYGCPHTIAAASLAADQIRGVSLEELGEWNWRNIASKLSVPAQKRGKLLVLEDAVRLLAQAWRARNEAMP